MGKLIDWIKHNPIRSFGIASAVLTVAISFGVKLNADQTKAVLGLLSLVLIGAMPATTTSRAAINDAVAAAAPLVPPAAAPPAVP